MVIITYMDAKPLGTNRDGSDVEDQLTVNNSNQMKLCVLWKNKPCTLPSAYRQQNSKILK